MVLEMSSDPKKYTGFTFDECTKAYVQRKIVWFLTVGHLVYLRP